MTSNLIFAPLFVIWFTKPFLRLKSKQILEGIVLLLVLFLIGQIIFLEKIPFAPVKQLEYLTIPPLLWAAFRFGHHGASTSALLMSGIALWATMHGLGSFSTSDANQSLILLQAFMGTINITTLVLTTVILERQRIEQRLQVQDAVSRLLTESKTLKEATPKILQTLCEIAEWEVGGIWSVDRIKNHLSCVEVWHVPSKKIPKFETMTKEIRFSPGVGLPGRVWSSGKPVWVPDMAKDTNSPRASIANKEGLHAAFCFPLKLGEDILGVIECFSEKVRQPDNNFLQILSVIGNQFGQFIKRKQVEQSDAWLAAIVESSEDAIISKTLDGIITSWNKGAQYIFGYTAEEMIGRSITLLIPPELQKEEEHILSQLKSGQPIRHFITVRLRKDGTPVNISLTISPVKD